MKKLLFTLLTAALLLPAGLSAKTDRTGLTVMSYNIRQGEASDGTNSWQYRYAASAMMIDDQKPDVIGLQEVLSEQFTYLKSVFDKQYKIIGVGRDDGKNAGERMAIMYNQKTLSPLKWGTFWLSETPDKPSRGWDGACFRCATWAIMKDKDSGEKFLIVNTHLDHEGVEARKNGCQLIADWISEHNPDGLPVVITGDFNAEMNDPALAPLKAFAGNTRQTGVVTDDHHTYNGWGKESATIDHIWQSGFSSCIRYETVTKPYMERTFISDHFPVKAVLMY